MKFTTLIVSVLIFSTQSQAKTLQEGWFQLLLGQQHIGYAVQRYSFDESKKQFKYVSYLKTNALGGNLNQSVTETCEAGFAPISYQYTSQADKKITVIDAVFKGKSLTAKITEDKSTKTVQDKIKDGVFFEDFLVYLIMEKGLKLNQPPFHYYAIDNETTKTEAGDAEILEMEKINGHDTFRIKNTFKAKDKDIPGSGNDQEKYISHVSPIGEIVDTKRPDTGVQLIAAKREDATKGFTAPDKLLKSLFGTVPKDSAMSITAAAEKKIEPAKIVPEVPEKSE